jgi:hypothetical protein
MRINIEIKNKLEENYNFFIEMWSWKENQFNKRIKKIKRMKIKLEKKKLHVTNWDWKMKLKTNQDFTKELRKKIEIKK